jgi:hypothetical protein
VDSENGSEQELASVEEYASINKLFNTLNLRFSIFHQNLLSDEQSASQKIILE